LDLAKRTKEEALNDFSDHKNTKVDERMASKKQISKNLLKAKDKSIVEVTLLQIMEKIFAEFKETSANFEKEWQIVLTLER